MSNIKLNKEVIFMWIPETRGEKAAREHPQVARPVAPPPPTMTPAEGREGLKGTSIGSCFDAIDSCCLPIKYIMYVICCCGCDTSYADYQDL